MIANRDYAYDLSIPEVVPDYIPDKKSFKVVKTPKTSKDTSANKKSVQKNTPKSKLSLVLSVVALFSMFIIISYRYNVISEKNLNLQRLKIEQNAVGSALATTEVSVDQIVDKDTVEAYAKQQLGMQKPEKSQMIYINSEYETKVESVSEKNILERGIEKLKEIIGL